MALPRFFQRAVTAIGQHCSMPREKLAQLLDNVLIEVCLGDDCINGGNATWTASLLINILSRLYPRLIISGSAQACANAESIALNINPAIEILKSAAEPMLKIAIGMRGPQPCGVLCPSSSGWVARISQSGEPPLIGPNNTYAASFAACLAAAEIFRCVFNDHLQNHQPINNVQISLLDFTESNGATLPLEAVDIREVAFVGLGAVGNAGLWAIARHPGLSGKAWLVDHEPVDETNLQRYVLASDQDDKKNKTEISLRELVDTGLELIPSTRTLSDFADEIDGNFSIETICISVDNFYDRRVAQALLPRLIVNGYTGEKDLGASWHYFGENDSACLACLYRGNPPKSELERMVEALGLPKEEVVRLFPSGRLLTKLHLQAIEEHRKLEKGMLIHLEGKHIKDVYGEVVCGSIGITVDKGNQREIVPLTHQSVIAGILMVSALVKQLTPGLTHFNRQANLVQWPNILKPPASRWSHKVRPTVGCICADSDYLELYRNKWLL